MAHEEIKCFVFTDIVSSTRLKAEMPGHTNAQRDTEFSKSILAPHRQKIEAKLTQFGGRVISTQGDGHFLVFASPIEATLWSIEVQQCHRDEPIETPRGGHVGVKIGIHWGQASVDPSEKGNFIGRSVDFAARIVDFATAGQVLASRTVTSIVESEEIIGVELYNHGNREVRGIGMKPLYEILYRGKEPSPLKGEREVTRGATHGTSPTDTIRAIRMTPAPIDLSGEGSSLGKYQLIRKIGEGGMGSVYLARHPGLKRNCVIKRIRDHLLESGDQEILHRFYREMEVLASIDHPHVVGAYDSSSENDPIHYFVMEYVEGATLDRILQEYGPLSLANGCETIRQAAIGLQYIHEKGLVHRDIKPSNLMLSSKEDQPQIKILDLGLALLTDDNHDRITQLEQRAMGTGHYMAPEQWESTQVDIRADIYSLGCTFYHLLAGASPFSQSQLSQKRAHQSEPPPPIPCREQLPAALWAIVQKMMAKRPEDRYASPGEVVEALAPFCHGEDLFALFSKLPTKPVSIIPPKTEPTGGAAEGTVKEGTVREETRDDGLGSPPSAGINGTATPSVTKPRRWWATPPAIGIWGLVVLIPVVLMFTLARNGDSTSDLQREQLQADMSTLPGLNGGWWFDETPWFVPGVRLALFQALEQDKPLVGGVEVQELYSLSRSDNLAALYSVLRQSTKELYRHIDSEEEQTAVNRLLLTDPEELTEARLRGLLEEIVHILAETESATGLHLRAVLYHRLHQSEAAMRDYTAAAKEYQADPLLPDELEAICQLDHARLLVQSRLWGKCLDVLDAAPRVDSPGYELAVLMLEADALRSLHQLNSAEDKLEEARQLLASPAPSAPGAAALLPPHHPLRAYLLERRSMVLLERWKLEEMITLIDQASDIRRQNQEQELGNPRSIRFLLLNHQIIAMAQDFLAHQEQSDLEYQALLEQIDQLLKVSSTSNRQRVELAERLPNIHERHGDVALYGLECNYPLAERRYLNMLTKATELQFHEDHRWPYVCRVRFKLAIAQLLQGKIESGTESIRLGETLMASHEAQASEDDRQQFHQELLVSQAVLTLRTTTSDSSDPTSVDDTTEAAIRAALATLIQVLGDVNSGVNRLNMPTKLLSAELALGSGRLTSAETMQIAHRLHAIGEEVVLRSENQLNGIYFHRSYQIALQALEQAIEEVTDTYLKEQLEEEYRELAELLEVSESMREGEEADQQ